MAFRISFFHTPKHRVFDYKPLYWDPKKEELEERVQKTRSLVAAQKKNENKPYVPGSTIRGSFSKSHEVKRKYPVRQKLIRSVVNISLELIMLAAVDFSQSFSYFFRLF